MTVTRLRNNPCHPQQLLWCPLLLLWCPLQSFNTNLQFACRSASYQQKIAVPLDKKNENQGLNNLQFNLQRGFDCQRL